MSQQRNPRALVTPDAHPGSTRGLREDHDAWLFDLRRL